MAAWEETVKSDQPEWTDRQPGAGRRAAARSTTSCTDGSILAPGLRADQAHDRVRRSRPTCENITAVRLELLNDPNLPLGGPGRSIKGTLGPDASSRSKPRPADGSASNGRGEDRQRHRRRRIRPRSRSSRSSTTRPTRSASPARSTTPSTARTRRPGASTSAPAAATCRARPSSCSRSRSSFPGGTQLTFTLDAEPRRLEQRRQPEQQPGPLPAVASPTPPTPTADPLPAAVREILSSPAPSSARPRRSPRSSATGERPCPSGRRPTTRSRRCGSSIPQGTSQLVLQVARRAPRRRFMLDRGDFLKPTTPVEPGVPAFLHPLPAEQRRRGSTSPAGWSIAKLADHGAGRSSTASGRPTSAPASSAPARTSARRAKPPSHPELLDWLAVEFMEHGWSLKHLHRLIVTSATYQQSSQGHARAAAPAIRTTACWPAARGSASKAKRSATSRSPPAAC